MTRRRIARRVLPWTLLLVSAGPPPSELRATVERLIRESGAEAVAVSYRDLGTGEEMNIRPDEVFHAASTMKVAVMAEVYRQAEGGSLALDERLEIKKSFKSIADGSTYELDPADDSEFTLYKRIGERETVHELTRLMIVASSNVATNLLIERVTAAKADGFMKALGASGLRVCAASRTRRRIAAG